MNVFLDVTVLPLVTGIHLASGWRVRMAMLPGVAVTMEPAEARRLAAELVSMADVLVGDHASQDPGSASPDGSATAGATPQGGWGYSP